MFSLTKVVVQAILLTFENRMTHVGKLKLYWNYTNEHFDCILFFFIAGHLFTTDFWSLLEAYGNQYIETNRYIQTLLIESNREFNIWNDYMVADSKMTRNVKYTKTLWDCWDQEDSQMWEGVVILCPLHGSPLHGSYKSNYFVQPIFLNVYTDESICGTTQYLEYLHKQKQN